MGKNNNLNDFFSRHPIDDSRASETQKDEGYINFTGTAEGWLIDVRVRQETGQDKELQVVIIYVKTENWQKHVQNKLKVFFLRRNELVIDNDILCWGHRIIIPKNLRENLLN